MSFKITGGKGFHMTFPNDVTVSVQFGPCSYCEHYDDDMMKWVLSKGKGTIESKDAEVAIFMKDGTWLSHEYDKNSNEVIGYQSIEEVWEILKWAKNYEGKKDG